MFSDSKFFVFSFLTKLDQGRRSTHEKGIKSLGFVIDYGAVSPRHKSKLLSASKYFYVPDKEEEARHKEF